MRLFVLNAALLLLVGVAVVGVSLFSRPASSVEGLVRRYATAVTSSDLEGALAEIAPSQRQAWRSWVASQLGNAYDVKGIAVRSPPVLAGAPYEVTVVLDVNRDYPGEFYQPTTTEPVEQVDGAWYLTQPLLVRSD
ncbi:MAG TPA: hypothetical protein VFG86_11015 [Chloroflexota bacterium]|nr:hypothetical protein [Chloroflexota bacterium]